MENRDPIIPARLDSQDVVAGLRAFEGHGQAAGGLGQAADAASIRFREAQGSVESALQEFTRLRQALRQSPGEEGRPGVGDPADESAQGPGALSPAEEWLGSGGSLRAAGPRLGGPGVRPAGESAGASRPGFPSPTTPGALSPQAAVGRPDLPPDIGLGRIPGDIGPPPAGALGGPADGPTGGGLGFRAAAGAWSREPGAGSAPIEGAVRSEVDGDATSPLRRPAAQGEDFRSFLDRIGALSELRQGGNLSGGVGGPVEEPGGSGRAGTMAREAVADYLGSMSDGSRDAAWAARPDVPRPDSLAFRGVSDARRGVGGPAEGSDPREAIWRTRASSTGLAADPSLADEQAMRAARGWSASSSGGHDPDTRSGAVSTEAIERLLREQNEMIRQDLRRNAALPIAAPPPMRGGGLRM